MNYFISQSFASSTNLSSDNGPYSLIIMLIIFGIIFYFMIFRPQQKRNKEHKKLMDSISKGDEIQTASGLIGRVVKIHQNSYVTILVNDTTEMTIKKDFVTMVLPKGTIKSL